MCNEQKSINIGIVNYGANTENGKQRLKGFTDYINKIDNAKIVDTINVESNKESATAGAKKLLKTHTLKLDWKLILLKVAADF